MVYIIINKVRVMLSCLTSCLHHPL